MNACALSVVLSTLNILLPVPAIGQEPPLFQPLVPLNRRQRDLNDPDLYVADYYPQGPAPLELPRYHYQYQFDDRNFRPVEDEYARSGKFLFSLFCVLRHVCMYVITRNTKKTIFPIKDSQK